MKDTFPQEHDPDSSTLDLDCGRTRPLYDHATKPDGGKTADSGTGGVRGAEDRYGKTGLEDAGPIFAKIDMIVQDAGAVEAALVMRDEKYDAVMGVARLEGKVRELMDELSNIRYLEKYYKVRELEAFVESLFGVLRSVALTANDRVSISNVISGLKPAIRQARDEYARVEGVGE